MPKFYKKNHHLALYAERWIILAGGVALTFRNSGSFWAGIYTYGNSIFFLSSFVCNTTWFIPDFLQASSIF